MGLQDGALHSGGVSPRLTLPACVYLGSLLGCRLQVVWTLLLLRDGHTCDAGLLSQGAFRADELAWKCLKCVHWIPGIQEVNVLGACFVALLILRGHGTQEVNARVLGG